MPEPGEATGGPRGSDESSLRPCGECSIHETLDALPLGFFRTTLDGKWLSANSTLARLLGYDSPSELVGSAPDVGRDVYSRPGERDRLREALDRDGRVRGHEAELRCRDGSARWFSISARLVRRPDGEGYYEGLAEDVAERREARVELLAARADLERRVRERTAELERANRALADEAREREQAERELRDSEERYRALAQNSLDVIMRFDREGRHLYVNASVEASTGIPPAAYLGRTHREMGFPEPLIEIWEPAIEAVFRDGRMNRVEFQLPSGVWIDWLLMPEYAADGSVQSVVTAARDITERKKAEDLLRSARDELELRVVERTEELRRAGELLRESEKMRAIGVLAGGIAHDFNNLLQALLGAAGLLRRRRHDEAGHERLVVQLETDIDRGVALSRQLLLFARREKARIAEGDLNEVLRSCGQLLGRLVRENVALRFELSRGPLPARVDAGQIEQVLVNLMLNACDAMTGGGSVTIRSGTAGPDSVCFEVVDTGTGIDPESLPRIFEPFFTTKGRGKGTGLGLSVVHGIVETHGGQVLVQSDPGRGATFRVVLPAAAAVPATPSPASGSEEIPEGSGRVLVVEDDPDTRAAFERMLASLGYTVVSVGSAEAAQAVPGEPAFDLLLTDYVLPGMNGFDLARLLRRRWTGLRVLVASGHVENLQARSEIERAGMAFLQKPFDLGLLARQVRSLTRSS